MRSQSVPSPQQVRSEIARHTFLRERLKVEIPEIDCETLADTLEGISDLREVLGEVLRSALEDEAYIQGLSSRLSEMRARLQRLESRAEKKRSLVFRAMIEGEIPKLTEPDFSASLRQGAPTLEIICVDAIPDRFWKPQPSKIDRLGLISALKDGLKTNAAKLADASMQLSVRTK